MIEFQSINASAGAFSLSGIDLVIPNGVCHVVVGPTGAGKTFLLECLIGARKLKSGRILIDGIDITNLPPNERRIAYVPQDICLFPNMSVRDNIWYGVLARRIEPGAAEHARRTIDLLVEFLRLASLLERFPAHLSGGERQRVALARALATRPALLALDEPFSAIDHSMREDIRRMLKSLLEEFQTTALVVTHDLDEAFFLGQQLSIMVGGKIIQTGPRDQMYYYPKTFAAAEFLGIRNIFPARVIAVTEDSVELAWDALSTKLRVPCHCSRKRFSVGQHAHFGIRSEAVELSFVGTSASAAADSATASTSISEQAAVSPSAAVSIPASTPVSLPASDTVSVSGSVSACSTASDPSSGISSNSSYVQVSNSASADSFPPISDGDSFSSSVGNSYKASIPSSAKAACTIDSHEHKVTFSGLITQIYLRGRTHTVVVEIGPDRRVPIEVDIYDAAARRLGIDKGKQVSITLDPRWIFLISN